MKYDFYLLRELLQTAKGFGGTDVESHLDAAENIVDRLEANTTELADALEAYFEAEEIDDPAIRLQELAACRTQAKAALKKAGR